MRDIKFRGKRIDNGEWVYGHLHVIDTIGKGYTGKAIQIQYGTARPYSVQVDHETVGQYTSLKDEDDKQIFEQDIISFAIFDHNGADTQYKGVVVFSDGQWQLWNNASQRYFGSDGPFNLHYVWYNDDGIKIIGNVHETPHLLEEPTT